LPRSPGASPFGRERVENMGRKKKRRGGGEVELNMAAMLDMAFQLLTFFILTFRPAPVEGQVSLRLPPPQAIATQKGGVAAGSDEKRTDPVAGLKTLVISVFSNPNGDVGSMAVGEQGISTLPMLRIRLQQIFSDPGNPFEQVIIQVGSNLRYDGLMKVVDICTEQKLPSGEKLTKLSFVEAPGG
jgi:biopolymer transport protein ExbD